MNIQVYEDKEVFVDESAAIMQQVCTSTVDRSCYIALAGGKTPRPVYERFSLELTGANHLYIYQVDERYVPRGHADANASMLEKTVLHRHAADLAGVHLFDTSVSIRDSLMLYTHMLSLVPQGVFDLMVLGIGKDGHIASLFPYSDALKDKHASVLHTTTSHHLVHDRLTLGPKMIMQAQKILVLLQGEGKQPVYEELLAQTQREDSFPAHLLQTHPDVTVHYLI